MDREQQIERLKAANEFIKRNVCDLESRAAQEAISALIENWQDAVGVDPCMTGKGDTVENFIKSDVGDTIGQLLLNVATVKAFCDGWEPKEGDGSLPPQEARKWLARNVTVPVPQII